VNKLINLIKEIKSWDCKVGLSTNGTNSDYLRNIIDMIDYVTIDIKTPSSDQYDSINVGKGDTITNVIMSKIILMDNKKTRDNFDYEIRSTLFPLYIDKHSINEIGGVICKKEKWILQQFRNNIPLLDNKCSQINPYTEEEVNEILDVAKKYCDNVSLKYV
jgi:pyruvate formate lyase activating enzyme